MPNLIRVRDVARNATYERGPQEPVLRVPYELFQPVGSVHKRGNLVDWLEGEVIRSGRTVPATLSETHPGERVLLRIDEEDAADEWWLCEIVAIDGLAGNDAGS